MSMMMRKRVWRGGRRVVRWCRRAAHRSPPSPNALLPTARFAPGLGKQVRKLEEDVGNGLRQASKQERTRRLRRLARRLVDCAIWWWMRIRWRLQCPWWLLKLADGEVHRCRSLWRRLRVRMLLRSIRRKPWYVEWLGPHTHGSAEGRLTSP